MCDACKGDLDYRIECGKKTCVTLPLSQIHDSVTRTLSVLSDSINLKVWSKKGGKFETKNTEINLPHLRPFSNVMIFWKSISALYIQAASHIEFIINSTFYGVYNCNKLLFRLHRNLTFLINFVICEIRFLYLCFRFRSSVVLQR